MLDRSFEISSIPGSFPPFSKMFKDLMRMAYCQIGKVNKGDPGENTAVSLSPKKEEIVLLNREGSDEY